MNQVNNILSASCPNNNDFDQLCSNVGLRIKIYYDSEIIGKTTKLKTLSTIVKSSILVIYELCFVCVFGKNEAS